MLSSESHSPSRSSTPTSPIPFNLSQRARVVSGITAEQVEAPKNYVDFDEEPDKLKDMLQGRQPRESRDRPATPGEPSRPSTLKGSPTPSISGSSSLKRNAIPKSLLSATNSAVFTTQPSHPSSPGEPAAESPNYLRLWCHVVLPRTGLDTAVTCARMIEDRQLLVVLQETGDLSVISLEDGSCVATADVLGKALYPPSDIEDKDTFQALWLWNHLKVYEFGESTLVVTSAAINSPLPATLDPSDNGTLEKSRLGIFEFHSGDQFSPLDVRLEKVGQWHFDGPSFGVGLHRDSDNSLKFFNLSAEGHFLSRGIEVLPRVSSQPPLEKTAANITIPNPFKALKPHSTEHLHLADTREAGRIKCDDVEDLGELLSGEKLLGFHARGVGRKTRIIAWSDQHLTALEYERGSRRVLCVEAVTSIEDAQWTTDSSYTVLFEDRADCYTLNVVDADNNEVGIDQPIGSELKTVVTSVMLFQSQLLQSVTIRQRDAADITSAFQILTTSCSQDGDRRLTVYDTSSKELSRTSWQASSSKLGSKSSKEVTSLLPLELDLIVLGCADGRLRSSSLIHLIEDPNKHAPSGKALDPALDGSLTALHVVSNGRTKEKFIVGGADDGSLAFWTIEAVQLQDMHPSALKGCVLCISADGTVAVIAVDGFQFLYLIPGSSAPLYRICIGSNDLLLVYADNRARLWDVKTQEFRRSMNQNKVEELLKQGDWTDIRLDSRPDLQDAALTSIPNLSFPDTSSTLLLDLERFTTQSIAVAKTISTNRDQTRAILLTLERLRSVLSALLTPGLNHDIDQICLEKLGIRPVQASVGFSSNGVAALYRRSDPRESWCLSSDVSAARALSIAVMLGALSVFEEFMEGANTVTIFYATSLASAVGAKYQPPSLVYLALRWFDGSSDVRRATRVLFDYAVACLSEEETSGITEYWQHHCFHVWQHYIDAMEILRALFTLATSTRKDSISLQNVGSQARLAVLQIASSNTALFMTTLGLDILTPPTLEHRKAVMQIVAFLIRKRPLVLQPNIPKLMEAVVRSLDPNVTTHREAVLDSATEIIGHVVKTFPTVDFHMGTQRLAVGSTEGAVVMYDLKTAIRLYVLEGHKKTISACSFSPDGRRLLSLSIEESVVLVWKVGTSFASFFNPGAPPRQGHGDSQPFKTISFNVGETANMNIQEAMDLVDITWVADRSVKIKIRDSILTFST
ncbi:hypothetical protein C0991_006941 [Blastosporella zonata]|nr:hypothetical protein C0991_006941 [Blastosporella zonata]